MTDRTEARKVLNAPMRPGNDAAAQPSAAT